MTPAERNPRTYFGTIGRFKKLIDKAEAAGQTDRAARLRMSLHRYRLMQNSQYGALRHAGPRTEDLR